MKKAILATIFILGSLILNVHKNEVLTVKKIMSDSVYLGEVPDNIRWNENSTTFYFDWKPMDKKQNSVLNFPSEI
jgi:hypothetical protein